MHAAMLLSSLLCVLLCFQVGVNAQDKEPTTTSTRQCVGTNELEGLRYHMYTELADSRKEIDTLRNDLQYWQNTTISILKKYFLDRQENDQPSCARDFELLDEKLDSLQTQGMNSCAANITEDIINQMREALADQRRVQSQELREIISEISSGRLPLGTFLNPAPSCKMIPEESPSGNYWIQNTGTGYASLEYCDMTRRCCNSTGGWMRVAYLDMTDPTHQCPVGFRNINSPKRTCGRHGSGCYSTTFSVDKMSYSRVCGRIKAYQYYTTDAFGTYYNNRALTIDGTYVDGVSLTHGRNPRQHIWTFVNALDETSSSPWVCPCTKTDTTFTGVVPPFIGNDYFCDTGSRYAYQNRFYSEDPLWDGAGCGGTSTCCEFNNPPWFCKRLQQPSSENIEMRVCASGAFNDDEDIAIEVVELYVQ